MKRMDWTLALSVLAVVLILLVMVAWGCARHQASRVSFQTGETIAGSGAVLEHDKQGERLPYPIIAYPRAVVRSHDVDDGRSVPTMCFTTLCLGTGDSETAVKAHYEKALRKRELEFKSDAGIRGLPWVRLRVGGKGGVEPTLAVFIYRAPKNAVGVEHAVAAGERSAGLETKADVVLSVPKR